MSRGLRIGFIVRLCLHIFVSEIFFYFENSFRTLRTPTYEEVSHQPRQTSTRD